MASPRLRGCQFLLVSLILLLVLFPASEDRLLAAIALAFTVLQVALIEESRAAGASSMLLENATVLRVINYIASRSHCIFRPEDKTGRKLAPGNVEL